MIYLAGLLWLIAGLVGSAIAIEGMYRTSDRDFPQKAPWQPIKNDWPMVAIAITGLMNLIGAIIVCVFTWKVGIGFYFPWKTRGVGLLVMRRLKGEIEGGNLDGK